MQRAALEGSEAAALFLATHGAKVNHVNKWVRLNTRLSQTALVRELACVHGKFMLFLSEEATRGPFS